MKNRFTRLAALAVGLTFTLPLAAETPGGVAIIDSGSAGALPVLFTK